MSSTRLKRDPAPGRPIPTRRRLIDAARVEFGEQGIEGATTRSIAERAGCNEVTLFRHFESKRNLLAAVVQDTSEEFRTLCDSVERLTGRLDEDLRTFAEVYDRSLERCEGMMRALIGEGRRQPLLVKELIGDVLQPFHRGLAGYLRLRMADGQARQDSRPEALAELFTAALMGGLLRRTSGLSGLDREAWLRETVDLFARCLRP